MHQLQIRFILFMSVLAMLVRLKAIMLVDLLEFLMVMLLSHIVAKVMTQREQMVVFLSLVIFREDLLQLQVAEY